MAERYDVAVVGLGAAGAAALSALAQAGVRAIGIDQFKPPHALGSSHGETRLLRTAYSEGAFYVPLVRRAILLWRALEQRTGTRLFEQTGVIYAGPRDDPFLTGAQDAARRWRLSLPRGVEMEAWFDLPGDWLRLTDSAGGYLRPERAIAAFLRDAKAQGAKVLNEARCDAIDRAGKTIRLFTTKGGIETNRLIVTTGAWASELVPELAPWTAVERRVLHWFADPQRRFMRRKGLLPFAISTGRNQLFYGFPANAKGEVKVGEHDTVERIASPAALSRRIGQADIAAILPLVRQYMPGLGRRVRSEVCMYPMSKDEHFILDRHPDDARIAIGAGLSGHGFKFAPAIGEALANLALRRKQAVSIAPFRLRRLICS
ncbi:MAG: N-methyl-L-tryptophan oxidase [Rhizomicrobium sp.]